METLDFPYFYEDEEDYWTNIDYTNDVTIAPPPTIDEITQGPERYFAMMKPSSSRDLFLFPFFGPIYELILPYLDAHGVVLLEVVVHIIHAFAMTSFVVFISQALIQFPGHRDGSLYPLFIPEHYGKRNSQHLFDPYSFVHFGHGILSYYIFGFLDDEDELPYKRTFPNQHIQRITERISKDKQGVFNKNDKYLSWKTNIFNKNENKTKNIEGKDVGSGLFATLLTALAFEVFENSDLVISLFRKNSGTSGEYRGDSQINVMGDLVSCALGYNTARYLSIELGSTILPSIIFLLIEFILAIVIRDNMTLMAVQIFIPQKSIKYWQQEIIPSLPPLKLAEDDENLHGIIATLTASDFIPKKFEEFDL